MLKRFLAGFRKDTPAAGPSIASLQDEVVRSIAADRTDLHDGEWEGREWLHIAVNHEVLVEEGKRSSTQAIVLACKRGGPLEDLSFRLSRESKQKILDLRDAMSADGNAPFTIADIAIERDGHYDFAFSYDPPPRLNGDLLHTPLKGLLERYKAEKGFA